MQMIDLSSRKDSEQSPLSGTAIKPWLLGLDIGGTSLKWQAGHDPLSFLAHGSILTGERQIQEVWADLWTQLAPWIETWGCLPQAIGVGFPGIVDDQGVVLGSPNLSHWMGIGVAESLHMLFRCPVAVENDANCAALAEGWYLRQHHNYKRVVMLTLGTGVGAGLIYDGHIEHGGRGFAGEAGHITVEPGGFACGCGRRGCLEQYFSARGIARVAREYFGVSGDISVKMIFKRSAQGVELDRKILETCADYLAIGLSNLCTLIDPDCIVFGGGLSKDGDLLLDLMEPALRRRICYPGYSLPDLRISHFHEKAGGTGCLVLASQQIKTEVRA